MSQHTNEKKIINESVHKIILAWLEDRIEDVDELIDDNITICNPKDLKKCYGKLEFKECLQNILVNKKIIRYDEEDFSIHIDEWTATVHYKFIIEYQQNKENVIESGRDFFLFKREKEKWKLVWRSIYYF